MKKVKIELGRRLYFLLISLVIVAGVLGIAYAYGGNDPSIHGHDSGELDLENMGCASYDSNWFHADTYNLYVKSHGLGSFPEQVFVYLSNSEDGSGTVAFMDQGYISLVELNYENVSIFVGGHFVDQAHSDGSRWYANEGYVRIIANSCS